MPWQGERTVHCIVTPNVDKKKLEGSGLPRGTREAAEVTRTVRMSLRTVRRIRIARQQLGDEIRQADGRASTVAASAQCAVEIQPDVVPIHVPAGVHVALAGAGRRAGGAAYACQRDRVR